MKLVLIASSLLQAAGAERCVGGECAETATLLQTPAKNRAPLAAVQEQERGSMVSALYQSTVEILRKGGTPEVVKWSQESLQEVQGKVQEAITQAHKSDIQRMNHMFLGFDEIKQNYIVHKDQITTARGTNQQMSDDHRDCREAQSVVYYVHKQCREVESELWSTFTAETNKLNELFTSHECIFPHNNVSTAVTNTDKQSMDTNVANDIVTINTAVEASIATITTQHTVTQEAWTAHNAKWNECNTANADLNSKKAQCDTEQRQLEDAICENHRMHQLSRAEAQNEWALLTQSWETLTGAIKDEEMYRKNEYIALHEVECLLEKIHERGGKPCEQTENGDEADQVISHCRDGATVDIEHLTIDILAVPSEVEFLKDEPYPCIPAYITKHYSTEAGIHWEDQHSDEPAPFSWAPSFTWTDVHGTEQQSAYMRECHVCKAIDFSTGTVEE